MSPRRGEVWTADLDPTQGSEQGGSRPVLIFQNDGVNRFTKTVVSIPFTTNLRRASLPTCVKVPAGDGGLSGDSVALCHQIRVLDVARLKRRLGTMTAASLRAIEACVLYTTGIV